MKSSLSLGADAWLIVWSNGFWRLKRQKIHWILTGMFGDRMQCAIYCNKSHQTNVRHDDDDDK